MVLNSNLVVTVADVSANLCQYIACNPERLPSDQVLHLIFCVPMQQFGRLALSLWTYLCYNPNPANYVSDLESDSD
ncbi:unnamed protein product [Linum tenue]|uniref:Uncharacterized protein n=1 Tax=Linum tenue TaxID=586396 RepID=A0AAV0LF49_9ROSI|nr:unnamed protein product [Linum tenue]